MNRLFLTLFILLEISCCLAWPFNLRFGSSSYGPGPKGNPLLVDTTSHHAPDYFGRSSENVAKVNIKIGSDDLQDLPEIRPATNMFDHNEPRFGLEDWIRRSIGEYFSLNNRTPDLKAPPIRGVLQSQRTQSDVEIHIDNRDLKKGGHSFWDRIFDSREKRPRNNLDLEWNDKKAADLPIIRPATNV